MVKIDTKFAAFDWDEGNRNKSLAKHGVSCAGAEEVFASDPLVIPDEIHTTPIEERFAALGATLSGKLLTVIFTTRADKIRVISARPMSREERSYYEAEKEESND